MAGYRRRQAEGGYNHDLAKRGRALQGVGLSSMRFHPTGGGPKTKKTDKKHVHGKNRIPYWIDRRLTGLAGPDYDAPISFGLPIEPEDFQYGKSRLRFVMTRWVDFQCQLNLSEFIQGVNDTGQFIYIYYGCEVRIST